MGDARLQSSTNNDLFPISSSNLIKSDSNCEGKDDDDDSYNGLFSKIAGDEADGGPCTNRRLGFDSD